MEFALGPAGSFSSLCKSRIYSFIYFEYSYIYILSHEDDGGPKFIKTVRKDALFRWTPKNYMKFLKVPKSAVEAKLADEGRDYQLTYDNHGVPQLPSITSNPYITNWRKPFAEYMQYHWSECHSPRLLSRVIITDIDL